MADAHINLLIQSFGGLGLPSTLCIPVSRASSIRDISDVLLQRLPAAHHRYSLTTHSNQVLNPTDSTPLASLVSEHDFFLPLRLTVPLRGGKGGFGSQLRAAGGRMSSKRKRNNQQGENRGSNRNLDGRRLRTVTEAKALAEYLTVKPEMERKEKEARRKRWEQIVEMAEQQEHEIKHGNKGRVDGAWIENKDEANERTREAVRMAIKSGTYNDTKFTNPEAASSSSSLEQEAGVSSNSTTPPSASKEKPSSLPNFGFDDDDEFLSDEEEDEEDEAPVSE